MPSCAGFIEHSKSRLGPLKFAFNAENFVRSFSMLWCLSQLISAQFALEMCLAVRNRQKNPQKPLFWRSRSSKVIEIGGNREQVYDFLLVINSNLGSISHRYWDTVTYWLTNKFFPPPSYLEPSFGMTPFEFMKKLYVSWNYSLPGSRRWRFGDSSLHRFWLIHPCDRRTDGQTDRRSELRWLRPAKSSSCFRA